MRTSKRLFLVVVLPTAAVGAILIGLRVAHFYAERDDPEIQNANAVQNNITEAYAEQKADYLPFSEDARRQEVASLLNAVNQLDASISKAEGEGATQGAAASQRKDVEESIAALSGASEEDWAELRAKAHEELEAYAEALAANISGAR